MKVFLLLIILIINRLILIIQARKLNKELNIIKKQGPISGIGVSKSWKGSKVYVLVTTKDGEIIEAYKINGVTIFAKFVRDHSISETNYRQIIFNLRNKTKLTLQEKAKLAAANFIKEGLEELSGN